MSTVTDDGGRADATLRVAVPNKGSLSDPAAAMLAEAGYRQRSDRKELVLQDPENGVEFFFLRPRDIAVYVGSGTLDLGITGRDLLLDSRAEAEEIMSLSFAGATVRWATTPDRVDELAADLGALEGMRVATAYPGLLRGYLSGRGIDAEVIRLDGAVETSIRLGVADVIADVVQTGSTLRQAGLVVVGEPIVESEAILVQRPGSHPPAAQDVFLRRIRGVLTARGYVMIDYDVPEAAVAEATALTPGIESPTVSPLQKPGWYAVRAMVPRTDAHRLMDVLWRTGARGILLTDIHACRL